MWQESNSSTNDLITPLGLLPLARGGQLSIRHAYWSRAAIYSLARLSKLLLSLVYTVIRVPLNCLVSLCETLRLRALLATYGPPGQIDTSRRLANASFTQKTGIRYTLIAMYQGCLLYTSPSPRD